MTFIYFFQKSLFEAIDFIQKFRAETLVDQKSHADLRVLSARFSLSSRYFFLAQRKILEKPGRNGQFHRKRNFL